MIDYGLIDRLGISGQMFYPRPDVSSSPPGAVDLAIDVAPGVAVAARFHAADPADPTVLFFHGNGEVVADYDDLAALYHGLGLNFFVADYRGYGASSGRPSFESLIGDAHAVLARFHAMLDEGDFHARRFVMGRSLGSHPAIELAANAPERLAGLIVESGVGNLARLARFFSSRAIPPEVEALFARHGEKIAKIALPTLVLHGDWDELVPVQTAVDFHAMLRTSQKELVIIPQAGHNDIFYVGRVPYFAALADFTRAQA